RESQRADPRRGDVTAHAGLRRATRAGAGRALERRGASRARARAAADLPALAVERDAADRRHCRFPRAPVAEAARGCVFVARERGGDAGLADRFGALARGRGEARGRARERLATLAALRGLALGPAGSARRPAPAARALARAVVV